MTCNIGTKLYRDWCFKHHKNVLNAFKTAKKTVKKNAYYRNANHNTLPGKLRRTWYLVLRVTINATRGHTLATRQS